jgi:hypothetical protein
LTWDLEQVKQFSWHHVRALMLLVWVRKVKQASASLIPQPSHLSVFVSLVAEINPTLLAISHASRLFTQTSPGVARFSSSNLLTLPYSSFDVIFLFGVKPLLSQLEPKLISEVKPSGHLLLYRFTLPNTPDYKKKYKIVDR